MEQDLDSPPNIWFQPPLAIPRRRKPPIDPVILIILIPILVLMFLFFFLQPFLTHTSHILKPGSVKSTWDSLNIFLVIFAILCGVLARKNDEVSGASEGVIEATSFVVDSSSVVSTSVDSSGQDFGYSYTKVVSGGLRRSSSSYPDLRNESGWGNNGENVRNRYYDDFDVYNSSPMTRYYGRTRRNELDPVEYSDVKEIVVDTVVPVAEAVAVVAEAPPPPPPRESPKRHSFRSVGRNVESDEFKKLRSEPPPSPPAPPPQAVAETAVKVHRPRHKHKKLERKVSDATKEIATAISNISSYYNKQKKRKNKRKIKSESNSSSDSSPPSVHSIELIELTDVEEPRHSFIPTPSPPPPPPPPPPPFKFQNLFKKGAKHKKIHSVSPTIYPPLPPPLPPPPNSIFNNIFKGNKSKRFNSSSNPSSIMNNMFKTGTRSKRFISAPPPPPPPPPPMTPPRYTTHARSKKLSARESHAPQEDRNRRSTSKGKPPLPAKTSYYEREDFLPSGSQSPLIPMPPPPPPPFRMAAMKFELRGDYVRIRSTHSSVCSSPDRDDVASIVSDSGDSVGPNLGPGGPISFPSPDVNAKADSFISRLKDEWRMEMNKKLS